MPPHSHDQSFAALAADPRQSRGRHHPEPGDPLRDPFEQDRRRVIECTAFRRLEGKTQVFAPDFHDHFRTRMTHTLEAASIARLIARHLRVNETLAETITLAHDLGHPPFGHAGEKALDELMAGHGGFNHNAHTLRVVEYLEHPFPAFRGLNLTAETLAGLARHETRYDRPAAPAPAARPREAEAAEPEYGFLIEGAIASAADRIAYNCHDLEDAIGAGFVGLGDLPNVTLWQAAYDRTALPYRDHPIHAVRRLVLNRLIDALILDLVEASRRRLAEPDALASDGGFDVEPVALSSEVDAQLTAMEQFLRDRVYSHPHVRQSDERGRHVATALFEAFCTDPGLLPDRFARRVDDQGAARVACDYIAGMTDRFCLEAYGRLVAA